ncbi:MAG: PSD1 and planctomycete cytochrome C domain-containing protein [Phycisphaerales bacterium JB063]
MASCGSQWWRRPAVFYGVSAVVYLAVVTGVNARPESQGADAAASKSASSPESPTFSAEQLTFFEERVRPVLAEHCYSCHSHDAERVRGGIYLDSRAGVIDSFAAEPGDPENSLMIEAVHYADPTTQMPPAGKLADDDIAALERWVEMGLPWPDEAQPGMIEAFDLAARRASHWCWQPLADTDLPAVRQADWVRNDIDRYILAKLEEAGLEPSPEADRETLVRRLTFDLIGLPPTQEEIDAFVNDPAPDAYERVVDRLLESPHFGEKWGRHWLDLVRYAETLGHEHDFDIPGAWRYRDYVIRAFNDDVPYDQLLFEHLAGDLMDQPRIDEATGMNASVQGTGWYWLGEQTHSPVDVRGHQSDVIANQIDVVGRAFQGVTIACARCHDHKFDAISTEDYYSLYGVMQSISWTPAAVNDPRSLIEHAQQLRLERETLADTIKRRADASQVRIAPYMVSSVEVFRQTRGIEDAAQRNARIDALCGEVAQREGLDRGLLRRWVGVTYEPTHGDWQHPLHGWGVTNHLTPEDAQRWWADRPADAQRRFADHGALRDGDVVLYDGEAGAEVRTHGVAFGDASRVAAGTLLPAGARGAGYGSIAVFPGRSSAALADRYQGVLQTEAGAIDRQYVHVLAQGAGSRLNFIIDGFRIVRAPIYGPMRQGLNAAYPRWYTVHYDKWQGGMHDHYVELSDVTPNDPSNGGSPADAHGTIYRVIVSDHGAPPPPAFALYADMRVPGSAAAPEVADAFERMAHDAFVFWQTGAAPESPADHAKLALLSYLLDGGLVALADHGGEPLDPAQLAADYRALARQVPVPQMALAAAEATPLDSPIFIRGSHQVEGDTAPRRYLEAIVGADTASPDDGSGRLELAHAIVDPDNPLTARVAVNRLWHHLFGKGIVASVDNLGVLGSLPTHPELLDHLARTFMQSDGWSTKAMIKRIVMSATYRQQSDRRASAIEDVDPENLLLHRQNLRRLTAEAIRDALLHTSGRLDRRMFGPSVMVHLTSFMEGRGRPGTSGPIDGDGRRSVYITTRRNFLSPMMLAFDTPAPFSTVGRRNVTNVPAQALILMNDPFVHQQAELWAQSLVQGEDSAVADRVDRMWRDALGRVPEPAEREAAMAYLAAQADQYGLAAEAVMDDLRPWRDLGHAIFNTKSFIYLR